MFVSKYDAKHFSNVKGMSETDRKLSVEKTNKEIWKIFLQWGMHCSTNEDVFQSLSYLCLYASDSATVFLPFLSVHKKLFDHLTLDKGDETEETNWVKRAVSLTKTNEVLCELKKQNSTVRRAVFVLISPPATRYWKHVRHAFVCLHTYSIGQASATTCVMSAIGDTSNQWPSYCWPNHEPEVPHHKQKSAVWKPLCKAIKTSVRGKAVDLQRMLEDSKFSNHVCLPYVFAVIAELSTKECLQDFFCTAQMQWNLHALVQKPLVQSIQSLTQNFFIAKSLELTWRCAYFPVEWVKAKNYLKPTFGECKLLAGLRASVVFDGESKPKAYDLASGVYILGQKGCKETTDRESQIASAFESKSSDQSDLTAVVEGMKCLGALADSCDGSECSVVTRIGQEELLRVQFSRRMGM